MNSKQNDNPMDAESISKLLTRYNVGAATPEDLAAIERALEKGLIELDDLQDVKVLENRLQRFEYPSPSTDLDTAFYRMLAKEKKKNSGFSFRNWFTNAVSVPGLAIATVTFILGLAIGYSLFKPTVNNNELQALTSEVNDLKEMMMLSLLEKESATDRLKAVSLTQEMNTASSSVPKALLATLNHDENVNVRLAALDALIPYTKDSEIRRELIRSISIQESPLVQIAMADLMVTLQEKSSVKEFDKLLQSDRIPEEIKNRIRDKIEVMI
jgi:hypothetical protein